MMDSIAQTTQPPGLGHQFGRLARLARKEITEILRDRRTIITLILMPLLLYPLMALAFQTLVQSSKLANLPPAYRIVFRTETEMQDVSNYLLIGLEALKRQTEQDARTDDPLNQLPKIDLVVAQDEDGEAYVRHGWAELAIYPHGAQWDLIYREESANAADAIRFVDRLSTAANLELLRRQLQAVRMRQITGPRLVGRPLTQPSATKTSTLSVLIPLVLILMTITGAVYPAIDLTAGERERGTLEILIAAPIPRLGLLLAKYISVLTVAMLTALVNIGTMTVTLLVTGLGEMVFGAGGLSLLVVVEVLALLLLFAAFFSAVLLALTSFARSFKEAQAYLVPLMLVSLAPGLLALSPQLELNGPLALVPLLNIVLLARDLLQNQAHWLTAIVVVVSTAAYALGALALAARVFGAEAVLYSESAGWRSWFRRAQRV
jgi:ABC-2 type transport system permease protein/sodium transport system permease protein